MFVAATATLYDVAGRGKELVQNVLDGFTGWLTSDGWMTYRDDPRRLRCWAHPIREARGLAQSCDREARVCPGYFANRSTPPAKARPVGIALSSTPRCYRGGCLDESRGTTYSSRSAVRVAMLAQTWI